MKNKRLRFALTALIIHLLCSLGMAIGVSVFIFFIWFPFPFENLLGGIRLFGILMLVDLICGPILTAVLSNPKKKHKEQWMDWSLVIAIQAIALIYGLHAIALMRPVAVVFEVDRFVAVSAVDIDIESLKQASEKYRTLSWLGPIWVGVRDPLTSDERLSSIDMSIRGIEPSARPNWWQDLQGNLTEIQKRAHPLRPAIERLDLNHQQRVIDAAKQTGVPLDQLHYLPLVSAKQLDSWVVFLNKHGSVVGYAAMGGFDS